MSSDTTAKENVSVVDSSLTDWKQDKQTPMIQLSFFLAVYSH
ncbi:unnamed protein product [Brassica oleracea var. botrytis]